MNSKIKTLTTIGLTLTGLLVFQKKDTILSYLRLIKKDKYEKARSFRGFRQQQAIKLKEEGLSNEHIAKILGIPEETVKAYLGECVDDEAHRNPEVTINYPQSEFVFTYPLTGIVLEDMTSVNMVIDRLQSFFETNDRMTVADLFEICGLSRRTTSKDCGMDFDFGWSTLDDFKIKIHEIADGKNILFEYHLVVPTPTEFRLKES